MYIVGKNCFSNKYNKKLREVILNLNNSNNIRIELDKNGISKNIIDRLIEKSVLCIRLDQNREVISTKVLNYISHGKPIILQKLKVHEYLLGEDYPFYLNKNLNNCCYYLLNIFNQLDDHQLKKAIECINIAKIKACDNYIYNLNTKLRELLT